jgi:hypothetical protein
MSPPPTIYTTPSELDGTVAGMIITAVVAVITLAILIGLVYWADSHPTARTPKAQRPEKAHRPVQTADPRSVGPSPEKPGSAPPRESARAAGGVEETPAHERLITSPDPTLWGACPSPRDGGRSRQA